MTKKVTEKYVSEIIQEAVKNSLKKQTISLNEKEIQKLEKKIRSLSEDEKIDLFSDSEEEVTKSINKDQIKSNELFENVKLVVNNTFGKQVLFLLSGLSVAVKVALVAAAVLFIAIAALPEKPRPTLSITPDPISHDFGEIIPGEPALWQFSIHNEGEGTLEWEADCDQSWMTIQPRQGTDSDYITVQVDTAHLEPGQYSGTIEIRSNGGNIAGDVDLTVIQEPVLSVSQDPLYHDFGQVVQGESSSWQFSIGNAGSGTLEWDVVSDQSWLTINPRHGTDSDYITVYVDTADLEPRQYSGTIEIRSNGGNRRGDIDLTVIQGPVLSISQNPFYHDFGQLVQGDSASWQFSIGNAGSGILEWEVNCDQPWITVNPQRGVNSHDILVEVNTDDLDEGFYRGIIIINSNDRRVTGNIEMNVISTTGSISISSSPSGASIYLDRSYQGITPMTIKSIEVGSYTITLEYTGYQDWSQTIYVVAGETTNVTASLTPHEHSISNIQLNPPSPNNLLITSQVEVTFDYATTETGGVRIFVRPYTDGSLTPNYAASGSPLYPTGQGKGEGDFTIQSKEVTVDQLRFQMTSADQSRVLYESFISVNYSFYILIVK